MVRKWWLIKDQTWIRNPFALGLAALISACAAGPTAYDDGTSVRAEVGMAGCGGCNEIHTFTSKSMGYQLYAVRDKNNSPTGQRISASIELGASNRKSGVVGGLSAGAASLTYLATITGAEAHLFAGEVLADANHPYRFLLRIHHNSSFGRQDVQLVENDIYQLLPPMYLEGVENSQSCGNSGCVWNADYVISAKVVNNHISEGTPLTVFIGNRITRPVNSKDGLNPSYETVNSGIFLKVSADQLQNFVNVVHLKLFGN